MRWKCICAYDGTDFAGWQRQPSGTAVQNHIEVVLSKIFDQEIQIHGSGRTDAGVHAKGQCFHFDGEWKHSSDRLIRALHSQLIKSIRVESVKRVGDDFHARYSVKGKRYIYDFYLGRADPLKERYVWDCRSVPLDFAAMCEAAERLTGRHDFTAYSATHGKDDDPNPVKTVDRLILKKTGKHLRLTAEGSGFLYRMVRSFAGALYSVGRGQLSPQDISDILESRKRTHRVVTAPAKGLRLESVFY